MPVQCDGSALGFHLGRHLGASLMHMPRSSFQQLSSTQPWSRDPPSEPLESVKARSVLARLETAAMQFFVADAGVMRQLVDHCSLHLGRQVDRIGEVLLEDETK